MTPPRMPSAGSDSASIPAADRPGLLLVNTGTPSSPRTADVRRYLRQFLMDPRVVDVPAWRRWLILHLFILPRRPRRSAAAYSKIWTEDGSPLLVYGRALQKKVQTRVGDRTPVALGMRYGEPSIASAVEDLAARGVRRLVVFPLFPHSSAAATGSALAEVYRVAAASWDTPSVAVVPAFFEHPGFLDARAAVAAPVLERTRPEHVFFSFHGLPERHILKSDTTGCCLVTPDCCDVSGSAARGCYRAQCVRSARLLAQRLALSEDTFTVSFQSRLGRTPWIGPHTHEVLEQAARDGCRRGVVLSAGFVTDCLETLEELGIGAVESWRKSGGEQLELVPALNAEDVWADALVTIATETAPDLAQTAPSRATANVASAGGS